MKFIFLLTLTLLFTACNFGQSKEEIAAQKLQEKQAFEEKIADSKEVQLKKIDAQKEQELAKIKSQTTLETLQTQAEKEAYAAKLHDLERADSMEIKRYLLLILFFILVISSYFTYLYFKRRHDDKLRAYRDNLDKYFHQQENMTKMRIAEKIIDTVASGKLEKEQESELIKALGGNMAATEEPKQLSETSQDIEIVEDSQSSN